MTSSSVSDLERGFFNATPTQSLSDAKIAALRDSIDGGGNHAIVQAGLHGVVQTWDEDGTLPVGWDSAYDIGVTEHDYWDQVAVLDQQVVIPTPNTGPIGTHPSYNPASPNSGARACWYKDFSHLTWAGDDIAVGIRWTGEYPYEATPLLHVVPGNPGFGIGVWPVGDFFPSVDGAQAGFILGVVGRRPQDFVIFGDLGYSFTHPEDQYERFLELHSIDGAISVYYGGALVIDSYPVPGTYSGLLGSKVHGVALDNNQSDENSGAGGARPANRGAAGSPFTLRSLAA